MPAARTARGPVVKYRPPPRAAQPLQRYEHVGLSSRRCVNLLKKSRLHATIVPALDLGVTHPTQVSPTTLIDEINSPTGLIWSTLAASLVRDARVATARSGPKEFATRSLTAVAAAQGRGGSCDKADQPSIQSLPAEIVFHGFAPFQTQHTTMYLRNNDKVRNFCEAIDSN